MQGQVKNEHCRVLFINMSLQEAKINHNGAKLPFFLLSVLGSRSTWPLSLNWLLHCSAYPHGRQRQMVTDYHRLVHEMKNALINRSHTDLLVIVGTPPRTGLVTTNTIYLAVCIFLSVCFFMLFFFCLFGQRTCGAFAEWRVQNPKTRGPVENHIRNRENSTQNTDIDQ